jgi:hypothetical protein
LSSASFKQVIAPFRKPLKLDLDQSAKVLPECKQKFDAQALTLFCPQKNPPGMRDTPLSTEEKSASQVLASP